MESEEGDAKGTFKDRVLGGSRFNLDLATSLSLNLLPGR